MRVITAEAVFLTRRQPDVVDTEGGDLRQETQRHPPLTVTYLATYPTQSLQRPVGWIRIVGHRSDLTSGRIRIFILTGSVIRVPGYIRAVKRELWNGRGGIGGHIICKRSVADLR